MSEKLSLKNPILFITRTYPPIIGGMENLSYDLTTTLSKLTPSIIIKNPYGKKALPFFIPYAFLKAIYLIITRKIIIVHLSDGVLSPVGLILKLIFPKIKVAVNIHGLDLTYAQKLPFYYYSNVLPIRKLDLVIPVSIDTKNECLKYGILEEKIKYIPNGTHADKYYSKILQNSSKKADELIKNHLPQILNKISFCENFVILFLGRLAKRKGMNWFVNNVMPNLSNQMKLLIAGDGADKAIIQESIKKNKLEKKVFLLGKINEKTKRFLLNTAHVFVMPNIKVSGDKEGFGISAIEAGACGLLPVVSDLEGLKNAIVNKKNGLRLPSEDSKKYISVLEFLAENPDYRLKLAKSSRDFVKENFDWEVIGKKYLNEFISLENLDRKE